MLLDASHRRWIVVCLVLLAVAGIAYVPYARGALHGASGGSWPGLAYGFAGLALMVYAGVIGLRRRVPTWRVGRATTWMKGHLWLGLLSYPLILFHSGFHLGGPLTIVLMVLFTIVVLSGIYGVVLQQYLPRVMLTRLPLETVYEQIDSVVRQLRDEADTLVASVAGPLPEDATPVPVEQRGGGAFRRGAAAVLPSPRPVAVPDGPLPEAVGMKEIYLAEVRPYLAPDKDLDARLVTPAVMAALFRHLRTVVPPALHPTLVELEAICEERWQLSQQKRLHHWLHGWLLVHVPLSMTLLLLSLVHAVISLRY
jgi:hypothetical protein